MVNAGGDIQFFGHHVVRLGGVRIGRGPQQHTGIGFEVKVFRHRCHHWPVGDLHTLGLFEGKRSAAMGHQANGLGAEQVADPVGPGTGGVDHRVREQARAIAQAQFPKLVAALRALHLGKGFQHPAVLTHSAQEALVQRMYVDVHRAPVEQRPVDPVRTQASHARQRLVPVKSLQVGAAQQQLAVLPLQQRLLIGAGEIHRAARPKQRLLGKSLWWLGEELAAGACQCAHGRRPVALHEHRR